MPHPPQTHEDILLLARWLERDGASVREIVHAIEEPWAWRDEINAARLLFETTVDAGLIE